MIMDNCLVDAFFKESMQENSIFSPLGLSYDT